MNKTKRGFELAGAIITIVISSIIILGCVISLVSSDLILSFLAQSGLTEEQILFNKEAEKFSIKYNVPLIITTDAHYPLKEEKI